MHLVFQVLFKNLGVDMKDITPTSLLKDRKREIEGNPDFSNKDAGASQPQIVAEVKPAITLSHAELPHEAGNPPNSAGHTHLLSQVCVYLFFDCLLRVMSYNTYINIVISLVLNCLVLLVCCTCSSFHWDFDGG